MQLTRNTYEEFFLLYVDNELSQEEREAVEKFVRENPDLAGELDLFHQTILPFPEEVVFENKESLYRKEEAKLAFLPWWRLMAAAIILLFMGSAIWLFLKDGKQNHDQPTIVEHAPAANKENNKTSPAETTPAPQQLAKTEKPKPAVNVQTVSKAVKKSERQIAKTTNRSVPQPGTEDKSGTESISKPELAVREEKVESPSNHLPAPVENKNPQPLEQTLATNTPANKADSENKDLVKTTANTGEQYASKPQREDVIYVAGTTVKKTALRGFFRKASRIFDKVTTLNAPTRNDDVAFHNQ